MGIFIKKLNSNDIVCILEEKDLKNKKTLLRALAKNFNFPDYFGQNWDALADCLHDFNWYRRYNIVLIHRDSIKNLNDKNQQTYLDILIGAANFWKKNKKRNFQVVFHKDDFKRIKNLR